MRKVTIAVIVLFVFTSISQSAPTWPLQVGQVWVYEAYDSGGNIVAGAEESFVVHGIVNKGGFDYHQFMGGYFRSTDTEIY